MRPILRQIRVSMLLPMNSTDPSAYARLTPVGCVLRAVTVAMSILAPEAVQSEIREFGGSTWEYHVYAFPLNAQVFPALETCCADI